MHIFPCLRDFEISYTVEKTFQLAVGVCYCLQTCNSVVTMLVMGLVLGTGLMVISITGILLHAKVSPLYNVLLELLCCCLQVKYMVYKHFDRSRQIRSLDPTCVLYFRPIPFTVF